MEGVRFGFILAWRLPDVVVFNLTTLTAFTAFGKLDALAISMCSGRRTALLERFVTKN